MKCSHCGKKVKFLLAYKAKGAAGHYYCSDKCARDANTDALTSRSAVEVYRGGPLELFIFCFLLPWWFCKLFFKLGRSFFKIAKPILKNKWVWTIFSCGLTWVTWKTLNSIYAPKK